MSRITKIIKLIFSENAIIPWMMFVALVPMTALAFFIYNIANNTLQETVKNGLMSSVGKKAEIINNYVSERKLTLLQLSEMPQLIDSINFLTAPGNAENNILHENNMKYLKKYFNHVAKSSGIENIYIVEANKKVIYTLKDEEQLGKTLSGLDSNLQALHKAFEGAKILWAPYLLLHSVPTNSQKFQIFFSTPVLDAGRLKAVIIIKLDFRAIEATVSRLQDIGIYDETFLATLIDGHVNVRLHLRDEETIPLIEPPDPKILELLKRAISGESGAPTELITNGKSMLAIFRYIPQLNMGLLMEYDEGQIFSKIETLKIHMFIFTVLSLLFVGGIVFWVSRKLWQANETTEQLLKNIFPQFVIEELKDKGQFVARNVNFVSILFVDLVDFTPFASSAPPDVVVNILTEIFSVFDRLMDKYQLEKIKTIGDSYMSTAGLITTQEDHANRIIDCALDMILAIKHFNLDHQLNFSLRAGVDTGTITAGIIGRKKFSYDLWGNAVNRASRMESTGVPNKVQITQETYDVLQNKELYDIIKIKEVNVKGIGTIDTYLVEGRKRTRSK